MKTDGNDIKKIETLKVENVEKETVRRLRSIFDQMKARVILPTLEECGIDGSKPIREQEPKPMADRKELDDIIFDILGLSPEERREVYWATCELVKNRIMKSQSL